MCTHEHDSYNYQGYQKNNFLNYHNRFTNAASCSWEIRKFSSDWAIKEADRVTYKWGKVTGICTVTKMLRSATESTARTDRYVVV